MKFDTPTRQEGTDTRTVDIEVFPGRLHPFGVAAEHRPDLPMGFDAELQNWVRATFDNERASAVMEYIPETTVVDFREGA